MTVIGLCVYLSSTQYVQRTTAVVLYRWFQVHETFTVFKIYERYSIKFENVKGSYDFYKWVKTSDIFRI
jgi:hypothetical protein